MCWTHGLQTTSRALLTLTKSVDAAELAALVSNWGEFPRTHHELIVDHPFLSGPQQRLTNDPKAGGDLLCDASGDPADGLLLHIKTIYPDGAFRLPTGGIHQGDSVTGHIGA
jgi:hypothetical protein